MADVDSDSSQDARDSEMDAWCVERSFTCTVCGYGTTQTVGPLRAEILGTCLNCGDWTVHTAAVETLIDAARNVAESISGPILTQRQALAYLLRELDVVDRQVAAEAMDSTPSNVDNLHRRGREKVTAAHHIVEALQTLQADCDPSIEDE